MPRIDKGVVGHIIAWAFYGLLAFLVIILWSQEGHCVEKPKTKSQAKIELTANPRLALAGQRGAVIRLRLVIQNGGELLYCPKIIWIWPSGTKSTEESDCDPYTPYRGSQRQSWGRQVSVGPGDHEFVVQIEKAGKVIRRESVKVEVK